MKQTHATKTIVALTVALLISAASDSVFASFAFDTPTPPGGPWASNADLNLGLKFTPNQNIIVNKLGFFAGATTIGKEVAIYESGTLVVSTFVNHANNSQGGYYWQSIPQITLTAGHAYVVDEWVQNDYWSYIGYEPPTTVNPLITYNTSLYIYGAGGLTAPSSHYGGVYYGPNLDISPVPESTTMIAGVLLLLPFGANTIRMLRRNRTA